MLLTEQYKPYNFSSTKCFVITFKAETIKKIEAKLPPTARRLRGIFISARCNSTEKLIGTINLNFNDGALKPYNLPVINSMDELKNTVPISFDEEVKPHSYVTGYYRDFGVGAIDPPNSELYISIYVHYTT